MTLTRSSKGKSLLQLIKEGIERDLKPLGIERKTVARRPMIDTSGEATELPEEIGGEQVRKTPERDFLTAFFNHDEEVWRHI